MIQLPNRSFGLLLVFAGTLVGAAGGAQEKQTSIPPLVETIDVEVVNVDVEVTDTDGNPIVGLTSEDFEIIEDGEPRPVSNFYAFAKGFVRPIVRTGEGPGLGPQQLATDEAEQRRTAILFDTNTLTRRQLDTSIESIERYVRESYDEEQEWAVIAYSDHLQFIERFTNDRFTVLTALDKVRSLPVAVSAHIGQPMQTADPVMAEDVSSRRSTGRSGLQVGDMQQVEIRSLVMENLRMLDRTTKALIETMAAHGDLAGHKSLILVTGFMKTLPTLEYILGRAFEGSGAAPDKADPLLLTLDTDVQARFNGIVRTANATRFSIYPISGLEPILASAPHHDAARRDSGSLFADASTAMPGSIDVETAPKALAAETGGRFYATERLDEALDDIERRSSTSYVLGFNTDHAAEGGYHRLEVKVKRPGLVVQAREGYLHLSDEDRLVQALSTPLTFPKARGDIDVDVDVVPSEGRRRGDKRGLTVAGTIPMSAVTLVPEGDRLVGRVHLYLAVYDQEGALVDLVRTHQDIAVPMSQLAAATSDRPARFGVSFELARGTYTVSLTLRDEVSERFGTGIERLALAR